MVPVGLKFRLFEIKFRLCEFKFRLFELKFRLCELKFRLFEFKFRLFEIQCNSRIVFGDFLLNARMVRARVAREMTARTVSN